MRTPGATSGNRGHSAMGTFHGGKKIVSMLHQDVNILSPAIIRRVHNEGPKKKYLIMGRKF